MIICTECGTRNQDGERFCGGCGAFLEWRGTAVELPDSPTRTAQATDSDPPLATATSSSGASATTGGLASPAAGGPAVQAEPPPGRSPDGTPPAATRREDSAEPVAVQPGATHRARRTRPVEPVDEPARTGGVPCPACQVGNDPSRRFCRACGSPLTAPVVRAERRPWWRRLLDRLRRGRERMSSRRDHRAAGTARRLLLLVMALCLFAVLAVVGPPLVRRAVNEIRDRIQDHVPLTPTGTAASSASRDTPASRIADGATNRYWAPKGPAVGAWVEVSFGRPVRLLDVVITPGVSTERAKFLTVGRPDEVTVVAYRAKADPVERTVRLRDEPGPQQFAIQVTDVTRIRLVVRSTHGQGSEPAVAIGEAEFFGRT